jgi:two-component system NarL family sensor kinase
MFSNQEEIYYTAIVSAFFFLFLMLIVVIAFYLYNQRKRMHHKEREKFQQTLLQTQLEIQEQTLKNISQEIHDNVGQVLTLAKLNLATTVIEETATAEKIKTSQQLIGKAIQDLRDLSRSLNTDYVEEMGLMRSVEYELELLKKTGSVETCFNINGAIVKFDKQKELILFRIVQEAIHNVIRHADAENINVTVVFSSDAMNICIEDNGKGFNLKPLTDPGNTTFGLGIRNMHARATLIGARFSMDSEPEKGTKLYLQLPINETMDETTTKN